jgi:hypothetical protein
MTYYALNDEFYTTSTDLELYTAIKYYRDNLFGVVSNLSRIRVMVKAGRTLLHRHPDMNELNKLIIIWELTIK